VRFATVLAPLAKYGRTSRHLGRRPIGNGLATRARTQLLEVQGKLLAMKPRNGFGDSRCDVDGTLERNVVGGDSQSSACDGRCPPASGRSSDEKNWKLARAKSVP
jgi:hypothetical protein